MKTQAYKVHIEITYEDGDGWYDFYVRAATDVGAIARAKTYIQTLPSIGKLIGFHSISVEQEDDIIFMLDEPTIEL